MISWHTCRSPRAFYRGDKVVGLGYAILIYTKQCKMDFQSDCTSITSTIRICKFSFIHIFANSWVTARLLLLVLIWLPMCFVFFSLYIHILFLYEMPVDVFCPLFFHWEVFICLSIRMPCFLDTTPFSVMSM